MKCIICNTANVTFKKARKKYKDYYFLSYNYFAILSNTNFKLKRVDIIQGYQYNIKIHNINDLQKLSRLLNHEIIMRTERYGGMPILEIYDDWRE